MLHASMVHHVLTVASRCGRGSRWTVITSTLLWSQQEVEAFLIDWLTRRAIDAPELSFDGNGIVATLDLQELRPASGNRVQCNYP